jgi:hypothetical protein
MCGTYHRPKELELNKQYHPHSDEVYGTLVLSVGCTAVLPGTPAQQTSQTGSSQLENFAAQPGVRRHTPRGTHHPRS